MGSIPWFDYGMRTLLGSQQGDGHWTGQFGDVPNTAWAILFITKSTAKTLKKIEIKRLKGGTLLGGRGLPDNIDNMTIAQGRVVVRPMNGAVEGMLSVLGDPRTMNAESALAGLIDRYQTGGSKVLAPHKDKLRKLLEDKDPGVRRVACWGLGRTGDLDVAPELIEVIARTRTTPWSANRRWRCRSCRGRSRDSARRRARRRRSGSTRRSGGGTGSTPSGRPTGTGSTTPPIEGGK